MRITGLKKHGIFQRESLSFLKRLSIIGIAAIFMTNPGHPSEAGEDLHLLQAGVGENGLPAGWKPLTFKKIPRHTVYEWANEEGRPVIRAQSDRAASGLIYPLDLDSKIYQHISWCWKINRTLQKGNAAEKSGDDYAARIYVTFKFDPDEASFFERTKFNTYKLLFGEYPPKAALNYVWANRLKKGADLPNAYTDRAHMVAVESGDEKIGEWVCEERNLYEDYKKYFGGKPTNISGIAVMTDTDNTGETAAATYADLVLK